MVTVNGLQVSETADSHRRTVTTMSGCTSKKAAVFLERTGVTIGI
jgi:hypothetical protein